MSWSAFKQVESVEDLAELDVVQQQGDPEKEVAAQVAVAVGVAKELIASGTLGDAESYHVFLSGNANVGHKADSTHPEAQHDSISVAVTTAAYQGHAKAIAKLERERREDEIEAQRQAALAELG